MKQQELENLVREILGEHYISLAIAQYSLTENIQDHHATLVCKVDTVGKDAARSVEGQGVGMVDALFSGLKGAFSADYPSLDHIHFVDFSVSGDFSRSGNHARTDAVGRVRLVVENASGRTFEFLDTSKSVSASSVGVVLKAAEHFVNAELAVLRVHDWIQDARQRHRPDLAERYIQRLADLVKNASYSESIERRRQQLAG